jgi:hypothetical protein
VAGWSGAREPVQDVRATSTTTPARRALINAGYRRADCTRRGRGPVDRRMRCRGATARPDWRPIRHDGGVKLAAAALVLVLAGCSSPSVSSPQDREPNESWLAMVPGDARTFDGPGGELVLIFVDETYDIDGAYASALTWKLGDDYTTDYFVEDDGEVWWYGRKGSWRAGRGGEEPREIDIVDHRATFGDLSVTLSDDNDPVEVETPDGVYRAC